MALRPVGLVVKPTSDYPARTPQLGSQLASRGPKSCVQQEWREAGAQVSPLAYMPDAAWVRRKTALVHIELVASHLPRRWVPVFLDRERYGITRWLDPDFEGGGLTFGTALVDYVQTLTDHRGFPFLRALDWCAGIGTIGFDLLGRGLADNVDFVDVSEQALSVALRTIDQNTLTSATVHKTGRLADLDGAWDLIVGNPPHVNSEVPLTPFGRTHRSEIWQDVGWEVHRNFFIDVSSALVDGGRFVLIENRRFALPSVFTEMAATAGLRTTVMDCPEPFSDYYLLCGSARP